MLNRLLNQTLRTSITRRWLVVVAAILITLWGLSILSRMPLDVFPQFAPPQVDVQTTADGLAPEEVESRITVPIESAVNGLPGVKTVRSSSKVGLSMVQVVFDQNADINRARQSVAERLGQISSVLPANAGKPEISPLLSPLGTILQYAFTVSEDGSTTPMELHRLVVRTFRNQILSIPGVAQVSFYGGDEPQQQVLIDPEELQRRQISLQAVADGVAGASAITPGGFLVGGGQERLIRPFGQATDSKDLSSAVVVDQTGRSVPLTAVAEVRRAPALKRGDGSFNGKPALVLMINKQPDIDTPKVTREVEERIAALSQTLPSDIQVKRTFRQASFIDTAINNVSGSLIEGIVIVSVVMVLFLMNWRTAVITLSAIPLSLLIGLMLMRAFGLEINTMTLGGLVVAIGSVVDDAIVDMENCYSGLRRNQAAGRPSNPLQVVFDTSVQVRQPVILSTVIIVVVFAPIFSLSGVEGRIFAPMGLAYLFSIVASTLVAITLTPALCAILLARAQLPAENTWIADRAERLYRPLLEIALVSPKRVLSVALVAVVVAFTILPSLGRVFLPEFREKSLVNSMVLYPGVSLEMTNRAGLALSNTLMASPLFEWVQVRVGRAPGDADGAGVNLAHVDVELSDQAMNNREESIRQLREAFLKLPGVAPNIGGFISHRMDEVLSGVRSAIAIKIYGPDLGELRRIGEQVRDAIEPIEGVVDLQLEPQLPIEQVQIRFDRQAAAVLGLNVQQLSEALEIALNGKVVGQVMEDSLPTDVLVTVKAGARDNLDAIRSLPIATPSGVTVPIGSIARVDNGLGANIVNREDVSRLIVVSSNVSGRPLGPVVKDIQKVIDSTITLPSGYLIRYGGQFESEERATANLVLYSLLAVVVIGVLMFMSVQSLPATIAILINLPLALVGGLAAILLSGGVLSVASLIGFITLFGVAVRNGLLLVDNYNRRHAQGIELREVIRAGSLERLNAILMTALSSALGMLPLALAFGAGNEILQPLAIVVLGGLITSTGLTLLVLPALYARFGSWLLPATGVHRRDDAQEHSLETVSPPILVAKQ
ncbi:CusA/CzcA family heavy metal efflux RND transporter [Synechococcus sp. CS-602]|uniref:efflux RND transporter permease subunit n=1 Tax=Synechococcaceae TaxID=1890426 RepID=UPI0009FB5C00|nr:MULTISPECIES: efflux RND transporter permease subunit [Synechococcaceae]MCT4363875.1 efflux RND transporter permease subunit [Candidatus Regnicoccus frigidus MAG-AL1]MCT0202041.1 CusA/CzcA family heavy metal efflux RND transporter [Synechococcus sp. CS-603]MCT0204169.1 CusA/CzcA family heavy metal efflux RND transporter [Synechococcus sp. CS-602]MCT0245632.1 CusA/CzcA family heavy metal efflux RND transporter [Synechococcus sp. CS-601]MCT4368772.1 efflux RND transporter permease subunit [Ca